MKKELVKNLKSKEFPQHLDDAIYDVILVGAPIANRPEIVKALVDSGVNLAIYGSDQWNKYDYARNSYHGYVETEDFNKTLAKSKIVLDLIGFCNPLYFRLTVKLCIF